ncbi:MAG: FGGY-family carbohydrate kinase [Lachnospiraceae bacterium]
MNKPVFIGCDIGTSGTKAVATDSRGKILAQSSVTYGIIQLHNNWAEQEPDVWLNAATETIHQVIEKLPSKEDIKSICISALYGGTGALCDENMNSVRPALIWMDRRAEAEGKEIADTIGTDHIFEISGNGIDSYFGYTKLLWVKKHEPENWRKIKNIVPIHSYIIYKMTGKLTVDYCSAGNVGGIYDYNTHSWSKEMCEAMGIPYDALPHSFHNPYDIIGTLNEEYQKKLGVSFPILVCAGTVDCIASMLSAAIIQPGDNAAVLGTSLNWGYIHDKKPDNPNLVSMPYCIEPTKLSYTYGGASTAGALPRWFAMKFLGSDKAEAYDELEHLINEEDIGPGADGLIALPYFMGERTPIWDEKATGVLFGLTLSHTKAHIYRAILEAVAYSLRHIMESMTDSDINIEKIVLVGGGARSAIWKQIFADVTGLPILTPVQEIEAPLGDAFMAAMGAGYIDDFSEMASWITMSPAIMPNEANHKQYIKYYTLYKELYPNLKEIMSKRADMLK